VALDQLDGQAGLSHASTADDHQLVLSEKLRAGQQGRLSRGRALAPWRPLRACVRAAVAVRGAARGGDDGRVPGQLGRREGNGLGGLRRSREARAGRDETARRRDGAGSAGGRDGAAGGRAGWCEGRSVELSAGNRNGNGSRSLFGCRAKTTVACLVG
jgi:hypothetical protein